MNFKILTDATLLVSAVFYGAMFAFVARAGLLGLWLGFMLVVSVWRFAYAVLRATAQGRRRIEPPGLETLNPAGEWRLFVHLVAFPGLIVVFTWLRPFGDHGIGLALDWLGALAVAAVLPASAAMMGLTGNLEAAFRPANLARVIAAFGRDYATLVAVGVGIVIVAGVLAGLLPERGFLSSTLGNAVVVWAWLVTFALTGGLVREHRDEFHVPGEVETGEERQRRLARAEWRRTLDLAYASLRSGLVEEGYATLRQLAAQHNDSNEILYWLFENTLDWEDRSHALAIGKRLVERQAAAGELYPALELFMRCRRVARDFAVGPDAARALAAFARSIGRHSLADELAAVRT